MKQCWDKDPDLRPKFNDVMEILEELSETLEGSMLTAMTQETVKEALLLETILQIVILKVMLLMVIIKTNKVHEKMPLNLQKMISYHKH